MGKMGSVGCVFFMNTVYAHDSTADFGTDPRNPIQLPNVPMEYTFLDSLYFEDGTDVEYVRVSTCRTSDGHTMDVYSIKRPGSKDEVCQLYFDGYVTSVRPDVPKGFYLKLGDKIVRPGCNSGSRCIRQASGSSKQGCLVPIVLILATILTIGAFASGVF